MALEDSKAPFLHVPWTASILKRQNIACRIPGSRLPKSSNEDSLFAETLKTSGTLRSCISFYKRAKPEDAQIDEVSTLAMMGSGMDGHPGILHGGIVASLLDEAMGILQVVNHERDHMISVGKGFAEGELPPHGIGSFTAELKIRYLRPVHTPGPLIVTARYVDRAPRKDWIFAEIKQRTGFGEDDEGEEVLCAIGEGLFIEPKASRL